MILRRQFLIQTLSTSMVTLLARTSFAQTSPVECLVRQSQFAVESNDSPFFEHFHQLIVPVSALITLPADGVIVKTLPVDQGSYDVTGFNKFIKSSGLNSDQLRKHDHDVKLSRNHLDRIASGEKNVEVRVISKNGNYVHNFLITASPMILAKVRKKQI